MIDLEKSTATVWRVLSFNIAYRNAHRFKGYLRTGQVLQLLNKADLALEIYKYGLRNVRPDAPNYKVWSSTEG
jgi:hypothetical protein